MLSLSQGTQIEEAKAMVENAILDGSALNKFKEWLEIQGADVSLINDSSKLLGAPILHEIKASKSGYIVSLDAQKIGTVSMMLGAGRETKEQDVDFAVGIVLNKKIGDLVNPNDTLAYVHSNGKNTKVALEKVYEAYSFSDTVVKKQSKILKVIK